MSDLNISQKNIYTTFTELGANFLIPDYQRPYSWKKDECETLWEDLYNFAFPEDKSFDHKKDEYFLGTIVTFKNEYDQNEVIDGQQRLITLLLLLRAFYEVLPEDKTKIKNNVAECIWYTDEDGNPDENRLKVESEVATDEHISELKKIIKEGQTSKTDKSLYAQNFRYFQNKIGEFIKEDPTNFSKLPQRIMKNCIILPIETNSQSTAFRIFTTLNDRGLPLSDSDIFKSQFYKFFRNQGKQAKENFVNRWKEIETICNDIFHPRRGTPTDDLFMKYMYYLLAKENTKSDTFKGLRIYYEKNDYEILKSAEVFEDLMTLANFWNDIAARNEQRFSPRILKRLYVLSYSPYALWENIVSLYIMSRYKKKDFDEEKFYKFLHKITAMFLMFAIVQPGVQAIRRPFLLEFQNILHGEELNFEQFTQDKRFFRAQLENTKFSQSKAITRAMLAWWLFQNDEQKELPPDNANLEIEHIYAKKLHETKPLANVENLELLGNKSLLEKRINIYASNLPFANKKIYYRGETNKKNAKPTFNQELLELAKKEDEDFTENDILARNEKIFDGFINYLEENKLLK